MDKVKVFNYSTGEVGYTIENRNVRRNWLPGQTLPIAVDELQEGLYNFGIEVLFREGILQIKSLEERIAVGLATGEMNEETKQIEVTDDLTGIYDKDQILAALKSEKLIDLVNLLKDAKPGVKDTLIDLAIDNEVTDMKKVDIIKKYTGTDVMIIIQNRKKLEDK